MLKDNDIGLVAGFSLKKYFGSCEKGCIFASAFAEKTAVEKKRVLFETDEKKEIACVNLHI